MSASEARMWWGLACFLLLVILAVFWSHDKSTRRCHQADRPPPPITLRT
jgi:hypothetical protein